jgi:biopolymer transport protein ExbD
MKPDRWLEIAAAPLASLFVLLVLYLAGAIRPAEAYGVRMEVPAFGSIPQSQVWRPDSPCDWTDDRYIVIRINQQNQVRINETDLQEGELTPRLSAIYANRSWKFAFLFADPQLPFGDFVHRYQQVIDSDPDLRVALLTPQVAERAVITRENAPTLIYKDANQRTHCYLQGIALEPVTPQMLTFPASRGYDPPASAH